MATRIRYSTDHKGHLWSTRHFSLGDGLKVRVHIDPHGRTFELVSTKGDSVALGTAPTTSQGKELAKEMLIEMGAHFEEDIRSY